MLFGKMAPNVQINPRIVVAAAVAALAVIFAGLVRWRSSCSFVEVAPDVYRCSQSFWTVRLSPVLLRVEEKSGLLFKKTLNHWVLVDTTRPDSFLAPYASQLVGAVQRKIRQQGGEGKAANSLDLILATHAHPDHVGALPHLLSAFPEAKVVAHVEELRYLVGDSPASHFEGSLLNRLLGVLGGRPLGIPADHVVHVHGEAGDLAGALHGSAGSATRDAFKWLKHGLLRYIHVPGHTPGHMALLHTPSKTLLAGDAVMADLLGLGSRLSVPLAMSSSCPHVVKPRAKQLLEQEDYKLVLPFHGGTFTREQALQAVASWPIEPLEPCHAYKPVSNEGPGVEAETGGVEEAGVQAREGGGRAGVEEGNTATKKLQSGPGEGAVAAE